MNKTQSLFYLTTALHVSGVTITHLQEHKTTVTTASGNRYTVLLFAAFVEELELIGVCCGWRRPAMLLVVVGPAGRPDHDQQHCYHEAPMVNQRLLL
jgi:hypothetical protein